MANTIDKTTTKRTYKHSEAWLAKHADKLIEKEAQKTDKPKKAKVEKKLAKKVEKKPAKKVEKKLEKKPRKQMAKKPVKKTKVEKKPVKKDVKKANKPNMSSAIKLFNSVKKTASLMKKNTKDVGKFYTDALKTRDDAYVARVVKLLARLGYEFSTDVCSVTFSGKVKQPKEKHVKTDVLNEKPAKKERVKKIKTDVEKPDDKNDIVIEQSTENTTPISIEEIIATEEAEDAIDDEFEFDLSQKREDETDEEFRERMQEEADVEEQMAEADADAREEMFKEMEANGDFS